jgi:hypothetical protein
MALPMSGKRPRGGQEEIQYEKDRQRRRDNCVALLLIPRTASRKSAETYIQMYTMAISREVSCGIPALQAALISRADGVHYEVMRSPRVRHLARAIACAIVFALASCATLQRWGDEGAIKQVVADINAGKSQSLAAMSVAPFLVDGEIVAIGSDVSDFWAGIVKAGFKIDGATLDQGTAVGPESYRQFAATMEVKAFFNRYVKKGSRILELTTGAGTHVLLMMKQDWFAWKIIGFKGPF